jgi:PadR family transcriptional regulator, phenolic acid-responsive transcriptional regulator
MGLDHILLGLVREPASGYDLKRLFDERIAHFWAAELSQIYPTLKRLEGRGWMRSRRAASKRGPGRRVYDLTPAGRRELRRWLAEPPRFGDERFPYLAQLYFMGELGDPRRTIRLLSHVREHLTAKLIALRSLERMWTEADPRYPDRLPLEDLHVHLALRKGLVSLEAGLAWCEESIARLADCAPASRRRLRRRPAARPAVR